ncbi:MAG: alpha/beta fold hydrolase, partial [Acidobacteriales bacterium]|nr:alpha/beta fold hydrolase [Terriglobales bacterium]
PNRLHGWWLKGSSPLTLIYHHGNGGNVGANADHACRLNQYGFSVLLFDYRGYGLSDGEFPSEQRVYEDADAAWRFTVEKGTAPRNILLYGHSLGGAVAVEMAMRHPDAAGLIVESSFTSILEMAKLDRVFRYFPLALLLDQSMDSIHKVPKLKMPVLFMHGTADAIVPPEMSRALEIAAARPKSLVFIRGAGHEDCAAVGGAAYRNAVIQFAAGLPAAGPALAAK